MTGQARNVENLKALVQRLRQDYSGDPNVRSIGWGIKKSNGEYRDELGVIFFVNQKLSSPEAIERIGSAVIPNEIDGFITDIEEAKPMASAAGQRDEMQYDPLVGGIASSNAEGHIYWFNESGTLGVLVRNSSDSAPMALSNWHVWADGGEEGDAIIQPGHPTAGDHIEGISKVAACGPLLTSLIEWEVPSPLAAGLYGGAAAAAVAAAASDYRDPTRRGQDQTPTDPMELTQLESVDLSIEYPNLPLPGVPFQTQVVWQYTRQTDQRLLTYEVEEKRINTQFLLGKLVVTDKTSYLPGEIVTLTAGIWDYQLRPCDGYHVVAHLMPQNNPERVLRVVLSPTTCPRNFPKYPPEDDTQEICLDFNNYQVGDYPHQGQFEWLTYLNASNQALRIVDWWNSIHAIQINNRLIMMHGPASKVTAKVVQFFPQPVTMSVYNAEGQMVGQTTAPNAQGQLHELSITGGGIVQVVVSGGGGEGLLVEYCITPSIASTLETPIRPVTAIGIQQELTNFSTQPTHLRAKRCCFRGQIALPPYEKSGKWNVHLTVQNVNQMPEGVPPDQAATVIGGHVLSSHAAADILGCTVVMLLDHSFDVI